MAGIIGKSPHFGKNYEWVVADAVTIEPVSEGNREKYRENPKIGPKTLAAPSPNAAFIEVFSDVPCKN